MKNSEKKSKKGPLIIGVLVVLAVAIAGVFFFLRGREEAYRNIIVTEVTGEVIVNREDIKDLKVRQHMNLTSGDELLVGNDAKVTLQLDEDKFIVVDENSKLVMHATGTAEDSKTKLELEYGAVFTDIKNKLSENSDYEVVTPTSTMSVRGTQFEVAYRELKDELGKVIGKQAKILTFEGAVQVAPEGKTEEARVSSPGTFEVLIEKESGEVEFESETQIIEAKDLSEFAAVYLKEDIAKNLDGMSEEEKKAKEELLEKVDVYLEELLPVIKEEEKKAEEALKNPPKAEVRYFVPMILEDLGNIKVANATDVINVLNPYSLNPDGTSAETVLLSAPISSYLEPATENLVAANAGDSAKETYGEGAKVSCRGWYDTNGTYYNTNGEEKLIDSGVTDGTTLELYAAYRISTPDGDINMVPCVLDVEMTVGGFPVKMTYMLAMPADETISVPEIPGYTLQWKQNGAFLETSEVMISEGSINRYELIATQN